MYHNNEHNDKTPIKNDIIGFFLSEAINSIKNMEMLDFEFLFILMIALYFTPIQYFKGIQLYIAYIFIIANLN